MSPKKVTIVSTQSPMIRTTDVWRPLGWELDHEGWSVGGGQLQDVTAAWPES